MTMISFKNVSKSYEAHKALDSVSFEVAQGQFFGLLGPNGAGKTTSLSILGTVLKQDAGEVILDGNDLQKNLSSSKLKIGIVPQEISLYEELSAIENLLFWGSLYEIPKAEVKKKSLEVLELVGLLDRKDDLIKAFSGGMKRRINIASALLHNPKVLLLDEPTAGVDPQSRNHIFELLEQLNETGMTMVYTTHYMEEVERLCDQIAIIDLGKIIAQGTLQELRETSKAKDILRLSTDPISAQSLELLSLNTSFTLDDSMQQLDIECDNISNQIVELISGVQNSGIRINSIETHQADLESVFLKLTGKQLRD